MANIEFFNAGMTELRNLYDNERLYQAHTTNPLNDDWLYFIADDVDEDDVRAAIRRKKGHDALTNLEDVTDMYYDKHGFVLEY